MSKQVETNDSSYHKRNRDIAWYVVRATVIALLVIGAKTAIERSPWGHRIEILAFEFLHRGMIDFTGKARLPVFVVDMSKIPGGKDQVTPRADLKKMVRAIAGCRPKAIAIDVDFSCDERGWKDDNDPAFFDFCLKVRKETGIPVFLGVYRQRKASPDAWLGLEKYRDLAVDITLPTEVLRVPLELAESNQLPALSTAVACAYAGREAPPEAPKWLRFVLTRPHEEILVNYSKLDQIKHETLPATHPTSIGELGTRFFGNKMVIIGDATVATDHRYVPGRIETVPGVYVHACAAYTVAVEPLYEPTLLAGILADLAAAMFVILGVAYARYSHPDETTSFSWHRVEFKWINRIIVLVTVVGIVLARWTGIMWLDFLFVIYALRLHPSVEQWLSDLRQKKAQELPGKEVIMQIFIPLIVALSALIAAPCTAGVTDCKEPCQATVTEVKGTCYADQDDKGKKRKIVAGDCFSAGQQLKCSKSSHVKIEFCIGGAERVIEASYVIPKIPPLTLGTDQISSRAGRRNGSSLQTAEPCKSPAGTDMQQG